MAYLGGIRRLSARSSDVAILGSVEVASTSGAPPESFGGGDPAGAMDARSVERSSGTVLAAVPGFISHPLAAGKERCLAIAGLA